MTRLDREQTRIDLKLSGNLSKSKLPAGRSTGTRVTQAQILSKFL